MNSLKSSTCKRQWKSWEEINSSLTWNFDNSHIVDALDYNLTNNWYFN